MLTSRGTHVALGLQKRATPALVTVARWVDESSSSCQETGASLFSVHPILLQLSSPAALLFSFSFFQPELVYPKVKQEMSWKMLKHFCTSVRVQRRLCLFSVPASTALPLNTLCFHDSPVLCLLEDWGCSGENLFMHPTGRVSAHSQLSSGLVAQKNHHTILCPPPALLCSHPFPSQPFYRFLIHLRLHLPRTSLAAVGQRLGVEVVV